MSSLVALENRIEEVTGRRLYGRVTVTEDTSNYIAISTGTVLHLADRDYYVTGEAKEGRFGIDDQPKFWVKYAYDLTDGTRKIIKLVFHERFSTTLGTLSIRCTRNPDKESRVLELVTGDERFMQGHTVRDSVGNNVRVIDAIRGSSLYSRVAMIEAPHERYFYETLPGFLDKLVGAIDALAFLEQHGLKHGDVRNDHILIERETGVFRWIDFDYEVNYLDYDVWSVGNILTYVTGKGILTCREARDILAAKRCGERINPDDALLFFKHRLSNLRKVYPYIPVELNDLLMRFSAATEDSYETFSEIARDLRAVVDSAW